jgi:hypothetical protein
MHLLTPKGVSEKLTLSMHFLRHKEKEYKLLKEEIAHLHDELVTTHLAANPSPELFQERDPNLKCAN